MILTPPTTTTPTSQRHGAAPRLAATLLALMAACLAPSIQAKDDSSRHLEVAGYLEKVRIHDTDLVLTARLDTGATLSSLNALDLERFERDGKEWVRFEVMNPDDDKKRIELEYPVVRDIRIVQHSGNHQSRPVVELTLCIGHHERKAEVTLADRSEFTYQLLVGRNHMRNALLIDPGKRYLHEPACDPADDDNDS
ncbi:MAG: RimK/LysX family protein [Pigmentiphaga sp.]|nr:RimK/LysX family protein [Pigmentiphaga sp.]